MMRRRRSDAAPGDGAASQEDEAERRSQSLFWRLVALTAALLVLLRFWLRPPSGALPQAPLAAARPAPAPPPKSLRGAREAIPPPGALRVAYVVCITQDLMAADADGSGRRDGYAVVRHSAAREERKLASARNWRTVALVDSERVTDASIAALYFLGFDEVISVRPSTWLVPATARDQDHHRLDVLRAHAFNLPDDRGVLVEADNIIVGSIGAALSVAAPLSCVVLPAKADDLAVRCQQGFATIMPAAATFRRLELSFEEQRENSFMAAFNREDVHPLDPCKYNVDGYLRCPPSSTRVGRFPGLLRPWLCGAAPNTDVAQDLRGAWFAARAEVLGGPARDPCEEMPYRGMPLEAFG